MQLCLRRSWPWRMFWPTAQAFNCLRPTQVPLLKPFEATTYNQFCTLLFLSCFLQSSEVKEWGRLGFIRNYHSICLKDTLYKVLDGQRSEKEGNPKFLTARHISLICQPPGESSNRKNTRNSNFRLIALCRSQRYKMRINGNQPCFKRSSSSMTDLDPFSMPQ